MRVAHVFVVGVGADLVREWPTRSVDHRAILAGEDEVLLKRTAGRRAGRDLRRLTEAQAKGGVAGVRTMDRQQVPPERSDVADAEYGVGADLPLDGEVVLHQVAGLVLVVDAACSADGVVAAPVNRVVGIGGRDVVRRHIDWKLLDVLRAGKSADEGRLHDRRLRAGIGQAIGRIAGGIGDGKALGRSEEATTAQPDTRLTRTAGEFADKPIRQ